MKRTILIATTILLIFICSEIHACQPCAKTLNFKETAHQADLIIIGKKVFEGPWSGPEVIGYGPDWIEVEVIQILKGETSEKIIKVNSWDAMCTYGVILDDNEHVVFLKEKNGQIREDDYQYDAVNFGCSVKTYLKKDENVVFSEEEISLENFIQKLITVME